MKKLIINNVIIISIILLIITATALIYVADFQKGAREQYGAVSVSRVNTVKQYVQTVINKGINDVNNLDNADVLPENYYAVAYIDDDLIWENDGIIQLNTSSGITDYTLTNGIYEALKQKEFDFYNTDTLFTDWAENRSFACFRKQTEGGGSILLFKPAQEVLSGDYAFDFNNIMLVSPGGLVITDYNDTIRGNTLYTEEFIDELISGHGLLNADFQNSQVLFCFTDFDQSGVYKVAAYINNEKEEVYIRGVTLNLVITIAAVIAAAAILTALLILIYIRHFNSLVLLNRKKILYVVHVNKTGVMRKANDSYTREFDTFKIYDNIIDSGLPSFKVLQDGLPIIVKLENRKGEEKYIIFFTLRTFRGYKLIGENATPIMSYYMENLKEVRRNENLNMFNMRQFYDDYRIAKKALRTNNGLYVLFEVRNITKYRSMFGEDFYNDILKKYADILKDTVNDYGNIYYFNYEVFVLLIWDTKKAAQFKEKLKDVMLKINMPLHIGKSLIKADCVAGVVEIVEENKKMTLKELYSLAENSLEKAYELKNHYEIYDKNKGSYYISYGQKRDMAKSIIENDMLELHFQPQYNIIKNKIAGFEALIRIKGKFGKELQIFEFVEIVERSGYMIAMGDYVFNKAFEFAKQIEYKGITVSVNVSPVQLLETGFVKGFLEKFEQYKVKKESIVVEITETFLMTSFNEIISKLIILRDNGVKIHLDDFGVAYSSMLYLKRLPISTIKIDKAFVSDIIDNGYSRTICKKIIELATELNLSVIAEGVETQDQLECLRGLGSKIIQGFYISAAVPAGKALELIEKYNGSEKSDVKTIS